MNRNNQQNKTLIVTFLLLVVVAALYRAIPDRPYGFAPHLAMSLFAGAIIRDRKWALLLPVLSLFISDLIYEYLHVQGITEISGFYAGQLTNYVLFVAMTVIGFYMRKINVTNVIGYSLIVAVVFFILSNFLVWVNGAGYARPKNAAGLMQAYADGLPFFSYSLMSTVLFAGLLFGAHQLILSRFVARVNK